MLLRGYGGFTYPAGGQDAPPPPVTSQSAFDLASLTKVVATTTAVMQLYEAGRLALDDAVAAHLPEFAANGKAGVTIIQMLTHTSGLVAFREYEKPPHSCATPSDLVAAIMAEPTCNLEQPPSPAPFVYSDLSMIVLALLVERLAGVGWADYAAREIFEPLGMVGAGFRAAPRELPAGAAVADAAVVPTELDHAFRGRLVQGE